MSWTVELDPPAAITGRTAVSLTSGSIATDQAGIDWGESVIKAFLAEQLYGEAPSDFRVPNRIVTLPLGLGMGDPGTAQEEEEARAQLQAKVALFQRRGGVLLRRRETGPPLYADIVNASLTIPDRWGESGSVEPGVVLKLECLPDFYGDEIELDPLEGTGNIAGILKKAGVPAVIKGDYPARTRVHLLDKSGHDQRAVVWALRSRYSPEPTDDLFFDAKDMTPINGAIVVAEAESYSGEVVELKEPISGAWHPFLKTDLAGGPLTHLGSFRVWVRCKATGSSSAQKLRLSWSMDDASAPIYNPAAEAGHDFANLIDLGEIRIEEPPVGAHWWRGIIQHFGLSSQPIQIDRVWLQPLDGTAGKLRATAQTAATSIVDTFHAPQEAESSTTLVGAGNTSAWDLSLLSPISPLTYATSISGPGYGQPEFTQGLLFKKFIGGVIPEGATIHSVRIEGPGGYATGGTTVGFLYCALASKGVILTGGGAVQWVGVVRVPWSKEFSGEGVTAADLNDPTLEVVLQGKGNGTGGKTTYQVNGGIKIYVTYSLEEGTPPVDAVLYANQVCEARFDGSYRENEEGSGIEESFVRVSEETGDLARLPPSGLEGVPIELFVKNSRGNLDEPDSAIDVIGATVFYRPCYIGRI